MQKNEKQLVDELKNGKIFDVRNKVQLEKIAARYGIKDKRQVKEIGELSLYFEARQAIEGKPPEKQYQILVDLYKKQPNFSHRSSTTFILQQYSTPLPIAYLAGWFVSQGNPGNYFEPSAGNGFLTIALNPADVTVNEIDDVRNRMLQSIPFNEITQFDARNIPLNYHRKFNGMITNPPFGKVDKADFQTYEGYTLKNLDHVMAVEALKTIKDNGKAAIIVGGHNEYDQHGRPRTGKNWIFLNYLYHHYYVTDIINISGKKLYSKQGTAFDVRLILIYGRKSRPAGFAPTKSDKDNPVLSFEDLGKRVFGYSENLRTIDRLKQLKMQAQAMQMQQTQIDINLKLQTTKT